MLPHQVLRLGGLQCHLLAHGNAPPDRVLVLCHGFGAPGTDLVPLAEELCQIAPELERGTWFLFPEAPLTPPDLRAFGGRAWWPLDMERLQSAIQRGEFRDLRRAAPVELPAAREALTAALGELQQMSKLPLDRFLLGGFSQGSMLATDVALRLPESPAGLLIYSGTLLSEADWRQLAPRRRGLSVLQTHGTDDPILPFEAATWLRDLLSDAGLSVEFLEFRGGHTIPLAALAMTARRLAAIGAHRG